MIAEIWNSILCFYSGFKPQLQPEVTNHCLYTIQTALNFSAHSFCCKITLICQGSSLSVMLFPKHYALYYSSTYQHKYFNGHISLDRCVVKLVTSKMYKEEFGYSLRQLSDYWYISVSLRVILTTALLYGKLKSWRNTEACCEICI